MNWKNQVLVLPYLFCAIHLIASAIPQKIRIGSVFLESDQDVHRAFRLAVDSLRNRNLLNETTIDFDIQYSHLNDFFHLYTRACLEVNYGIISLFGPSERTLDRMLESISSNLGIPYISTSPRPEMTNGITESKLMLALHPTQTQMITLIKDMAVKLDWKEASIIHDSVHGIVEPSLLAESLQFLGPVSVHSVSVDLRATLVKLRLRGARNIIIDTSVDNLPSVTQATLDTGMMTKSYTYIFTMLDMKSGNWTRLSYSEALVFGFNIIDEKKFQDFQDGFAPLGSAPTVLEDRTKVALTLDAVELMARGLEAFDDSGTDLSNPTPTSCSEEKKWDIGVELVDAFASVSFDGMTGPISISSGTRMKIFVEVLKLNFEFGLDSPVIVTVGNWTQGIDFEYEGLLISDNELVTNEKPVVNKTLIITTIESDSCYRLTSMGEEEGYCVELATHLSKLVGFDYKFKIVADNRYGRPDTITGYWDGMIGELTRGEADLAVADLTITSARANVVDFSVPFKYTSLGILYKEAEATMLQIKTLIYPFTCWVWFSIYSAAILTSIALRVVSWLSPIHEHEIVVATSDGDSSRRKGLSLANSMWVIASSLVLRGCDIKLKAISSRTVAVAWWMFALVVIIIYASLVPHWLVPGISPLRANSMDALLNDETVDFGVTQSSSSLLLLQNAKKENLQKIWWKIQKSAPEMSLQENTSSGIRQVQNSDGHFAFISEETNLKQAQRTDCDLRILEHIDHRAFGVALPKGSHLRERISQAVLALGESGTLKQLEEKWWPEPICEEKTGKPRLDLVHFLGPLCLLLIGIILSVLQAMWERMVHHRRSHRGFFRTHADTGNGKIAMNDTESDE